MISACAAASEMTTAGSAITTGAAAADGVCCSASRLQPARTNVAAIAAQNRRVILTSCQLKAAIKRPNAAKYSPDCEVYKAYNNSLVR